MKIVILAVLTVFALAESVLAQSCYTPTYQRHYTPTYHPHQVYQSHDYYTYRYIDVPVLQAVPVFVDPRLSYAFLGNNQGALLQAQQQQAKPVEKETPKDDMKALFNKWLAEKQMLLEPAGPPIVPGFFKTSFVEPSGDPADVLTANCASCHTGAKAKGAFVIFVSAGVLNPKVDMDAIRDAVRDGAMPPKGQPRLSVAAKKQLGV